MLSICTFPMSPAKNSSSVTAALISLRAGRRSSSLDNLTETKGRVDTLDLKCAPKLASSRISTSWPLVKSKAYWPIRVLWVGPSHVILQLHVGFFLKPLYLWGVIDARVIWWKYKMHTRRGVSLCTRSASLSNSFQASSLCAQDERVSFKFCKLPRYVRTRAEENNGFEVGVFIRVWRQLQHAVTELLHPPNVLHD